MELENDDFTIKEKELLKRHCIPLQLVLDARNLRTKEYKEMARNEGWMAVKSAKPCKRGHYIKTRSGHCLKCSPATQKFRERYAESGILYLLYSVDTGLIKCGITDDLSRRLSEINNYRYAGSSQWCVFISVEVDMVGTVERLVHRALKQYQVVVEYTKGGSLNQSNEVFDVDSEIASFIVKKIIKDDLFQASNFKLDNSIVTIKPLYSEKNSKEAVSGTETFLYEEDVKSLNATNEIISANNENKYITEKNLAENSYANDNKGARPKVENIRPYEELIDKTKVKSSNKQEVEQKSGSKIPLGWSWPINLLKTALLFLAFYAFAYYFIIDK